MRIFLSSFVCVLAMTAVSCSTGPTAPTNTIASPATETFSSLLAVKGTASRSFSTHNRGTISVTLTSTSPAGTVVGVGVGIPRIGNTGCNLTTSVNTAAGSGAQISVTAETGDYCVQIYDLGTLSAQLAFTLSFTHP